tara:strand:- start:306 stop:1250 length:945 start_codon:yes stop_codon:yes gene_type:complete
MAKPFKSEFDLMAEAYGTISYNKQQTINEDKAGRRVIGYPPQHAQIINESSCNSDEEHSSIEIGGQTYTVGEQDPNDDGTIIEIKKHSNGYFITGGEYTDMQGEGSYADDRDNPKVGYGYALTLDGKPMEEDDLEDGLGHSEDAEHEDAEHEDAESLEMVGWEEIGLNYAVVRTMFEDESGQNVAGKYLDVASLKNMIANREDNMKAPGMRDAGMAGQLMKMSKQLSGLNDAVVVNFNKDIKTKSEDGEHEDAEKVDYGPSGEGKPVHPDEDAEGASPIQACMAAIDELAATLQGDDKLAAFEDLRDYLNAKLG